MKVCLYMAVSANGFIATANDKTPWSDEEWASYREMVTTAGNLVIGRRTYEIMREGDEFAKIGNPLTVVVTSDKSKHATENFVFADHPRLALQIIRENGFATALVAGGSQLNRSILTTGLIDEFYLDVEPFLFGQGLPLFAPSDLCLKLTLATIKHLGPNTVQLHYRKDGQFVQ